jgi:hypothetical protein
LEENTPSVTGATELMEWYKLDNKSNSLATARTALGGAGTQTAALAFGGSGGTHITPKNGQAHQRL